ncbi:HAL/PAL/TAL family ammonia-lyase [Paeniglutamicibacter kerguelensis]|uniref:Histidine ammonia-lyase n=1 Tax=Paeniglutamicibacter kerguelensis TaxID=254788 RepID=A0ABS4X8A7_9MICC|nr:histidine ammonia-lyase [Paeniglutamicibacter kerguelensis]MBP2384586.1 histidine ammonia-lyase [Paeniglutamicibacter kerguelensis]
MTTTVLAEAAPVTIGVHRATLDDLIQVARHRRPVVIDEAVFETMRPSQEWLQGVVDQMGPGKQTPPIYSINTGFGSLAGRQAFAEPSDAAELSRRLVLSNAAGVGRHVDEEVVRATMFIRIVSLTQGYSGVRPEIITTLAKMLNAGVCPAIPEYGSLGASGDLIPLAHVAIVMSRSHTGEDLELDSGEALVDGNVVSGIAAMRHAGIERLPLGAKDGLALLNGTSFSCAQAALALFDAQNLLETAQITAAMSIEALMGFGDAFIDELHQARGQRGQIEVAARIRELLAGSTLIDGNASTDPVRQPPQDAYSLRCVPQVFGAIKDTLGFAAGIIDNEINAATDNPLIFPALPDTRKLKAVSGGNFHAEYVAFAADFISIVVTEIGNITERRLFRLDDGTLNRGLPDMLIDSEQTGMDCGYMLPQYLAAALVSDCKTLAHPDSVDSIPTCANQEDHVSMANNAGRHARQIVANIESVVGIELLMAAQALELRAMREETGDARPGPASAAALALVRSSKSADGRPVDHIRKDVVLYPRVRKALDLVHSGAVVETVNKVLAG